MYQNPSNGNIIKLLLIIAVMTVISYFFYLVVPLILNQSSSDITFGNNLPITNPDNFTTVVSISDDSDGKKFVEVEAILVPEKSKLDGQLSCIHEISIMNAVQIPRGGFNENNELWDIDERIFPSDGQPVFVVSNDPYIMRLESSRSWFNEICARDNPQELSIYTLRDSYDLKGPVTTFNIPSENDLNSDASFHSTVTSLTPLYFYPFDRYRIQLSVFLQTQNASIRSDIIGKVKSSNWDSWATINQTYSIEHPTTLEIEFSRPAPVRYLISSLLLSLFLIIVFSMFIKDMATYLGVLLGVLLGIDGLRPVMRLPEATGTTMIDAFFLSFYILLGVTLFIRFIVYSLLNIKVQEHRRNLLPRSKPMKKNRNGTK